MGCDCVRWEGMNIIVRLSVGRDAKIEGVLMVFINKDGN